MYLFKHLKVDDLKSEMLCANNSLQNNSRAGANCNNFDHTNYGSVEPYYEDIKNGIDYSQVGENTNLIVSPLENVIFK